MSGRFLRRVGEQLGLFEELAQAPRSEKPVRKVWLGAQPVPYELTRARRRSIGFTVSPDGLRVRAPQWISLADIEAALQARSAWILRQFQQQQQRQQQQALLRVQWGEQTTLPYLGAPLRVERGATAAHLPSQDGEPARLLLRLPEGAQEAQWRDAAQAWLQAQARAWFAQRLAHFAGQLGVATPRLRLSSAKGRWGSASSQGVVSLNWRLMHFSPALIDYVVAHEVAHLREMNHGPQFWAVLGQLLPGFEQAREELKRAELPGL